MAITIKDVAKDAGVAISTVSKYMNGGNVRKENQIKIEESIEKLGYKPNEYARSLRGSKTWNIGFLVDNVKAIFSTQIVGLLEQRMKKYGYSILLGSHGNDYDTAKKMIDTLVNDQVDAIVLEPLEGNIGYLESAEKANIPIIAIDRVLDVHSYDSITSNAMLGIYNGVEYLIRNGHEKIAIISATQEGTIGIKSGSARLKGYIRALEDYEIELNKDYIFEGDFSFDSGYRCMKKIWELEDCPTAVIVANYHMGLGMISAIHELNINVPEDLSFVSFDDMPAYKMFNPQITAIAQPIHEYAKTISDLVFKRIQGDYSDFPINIKLHTELIERETVRKLTKNK